MASASSNPEDLAYDFHPEKKRRLQRACDVCRRKRTACDGSQMTGKKCTTCIEANVDCTYVEIPPKRAPPKSYVDRLEDSEALVRQLRADLSSVRSELADVRAELATAHSARLPNSEYPCSSTSSALADTTAEAHTGSQDVDVPAAALSVMRATLRSITAAPTAPHLDDVLDVDIASKFQKLQVGMAENAFFGRSSGAFLVNAALDLKPDANSEVPEPFTIEGDSRASVVETWTSRRLRFWTGTLRHDTRSNNAFRFPEGVLMRNLIELFFARQNIFLPLLHRPTFERGVAEGLHLRNCGFAATVLLVCAIGAQWRVETSGADAGLDCGRAWFDQVQLDGMHSFLLGHPTLYDVQRYCLAAQFLNASAMPQACWTLVGVGLRLAQDLGMHRSKGPTGVPTVEGELHKRAYWVLVYLDRVASSDLGRTCSVHYTDFDVEPPLEVDDEYWEHPTRPFQQPAHKPSRITFFNTLMRLNHILDFTLKILYSLKRVRTVYSVDDAWELQAIAELDSTLNNWRDQLPDHLRWDPMREDPVFFDQSAAIHAAYFDLQITIHRPFIPMLRRAPTGVPSLILCTSAARGCANVMNVQRRRRGNIPFPLHLNAAFVSALVLLLNILSAKRRGSLPDPSRELAHVHKCMEVIRLCEGRWKSAGVMWDVLYEVAAMGQLPLPKTTTPTNHCDATDDVEQHTTNLVSDDLSSAGNLWSSDPAIHPASYPLFTDGVDIPEMHNFMFSAPPPPTTLPSESTSVDLYPDPTQASRELADMMNLMDADLDTMAVWTTVPTGLGVDDWGAYFSSFNQMPVAERDSEGRRYDG
ncbi:fungal-specific transcription factor domain-containing protein [Mycena sanguinolenta]|nr:fungal-specific transcription factor domain-containing protein [Mycena sanguinolenta]